MPHALRMAVVSSLLALSACQQGPIAMTDTTSDTPAARDASRAEYRRNPDPREAYRITMRIKDAPGPFASMRALAQYDVTNRECLAPPRDNPGGRSSPVPTEDVEIALTPTGDGQYAATVYGDYMLDEDYTGNGACHWELMQFRVHMKATGAKGETLFIPSIPDRKLLAGESETVYFNKVAYPRRASSELEEPLSLGESDRSRYGPSIRDDELFTVTFDLGKDAAP